MKKPKKAVVLLLVIMLCFSAAAWAKGPDIAKNPRLADILQNNLGRLVARGVPLPDFLTAIACPGDGDDAGGW